MAPVIRAAAVMTMVVPNAHRKMSFWCSPRSTLLIPTRMKVAAVSGLSGKPGGHLAEDGRASDLRGSPPKDALVSARTGRTPK